MRPNLYIFAGLPGTGKTTLAKMLAEKQSAVYLRIDSIEQTLRDLCNLEVEGEGYEMAYRVASDNLKLRLNVVVDSCNTIELTRRAWESVATENGATYTNIEVVCSDLNEHQRRIESRTTDIAGLQLPDWESVLNREYHQWQCDRIMIDTAVDSKTLAFENLINQLSNH